ncbi:LOW QUALITY PROTEIN: Hypothetical protein PHPALM_18359 [Phytophthora palmivora]|uniref:RNase H type-1 domain-containing protein n=1 Tax=Phytophthora palmivora TaxID=4796 RepID=A0A2P4XJX4_9STRA|nr:LOW QUALITY PROTEIN: Hypothetical protein PHPALM_18359 [Phytophthora palmivora]
MISSGNALPPPAYGVVCDIDVGDHPPIKQRARRVALKLCIDYKQVNAITMIMEYAMPLVDDLLSELEKYLWFCSLDAASRVWAVMMTSRARRISAFVCALGHFEWLRMPFGLKNAPMIYQRMIDNALWGYVQPKGGWSEFASRIRRAEEVAATLVIAELPFLKSKKGIQAFLGALNYYNRFIQNLAVYGAVLYQLKDSNKDLSTAQAAFAELKVATAPILRHLNSTKEVHIMLFANNWALSGTLMQMHDDKLHPVRFCGRVLKENEVNYHPAEKEVLALLQLLKICHTLLAGKVLHVYTRFSTLEWVFQSTSLYGRAVSFAVLLSPYLLKIKRVRERDVDFVQLLQASITPHVGRVTGAHRPPSKNSATVRLDPELMYAKLPRHYKGLVLSFDGSAKTEKNGGYGSCSWILWRLPEWDIEIAASAYLSSTTVNLAEYTGMNNGVKAAIDRGVTDLVIVGDSRLAIQ